MKLLNIVEKHVWSSESVFVPSQTISFRIKALYILIIDLLSHISFSHLNLFEWKLNNEDDELNLKRKCIQSNLNVHLLNSFDAILRKKRIGTDCLSCLNIFVLEDLIMFKIIQVPQCSYSSRFLQSNHLTHS